uniref:Uncharacterized protein n=1 Tax=Schistocephalus solidus TaxID=70667 RepID=A0A0X3PJH5_SCHSO
MIRLKPRRRSQGKRPPGKLNTALLNTHAHHLHFINVLAQRLASLPVAGVDAFVENRCCQLRYTVQSITMDAFSCENCQHQDQSDDNTATSNLVIEKNRLRETNVDRPTDANKAASYLSRCLVQLHLREMEDAWMVGAAEGIQGYADRDESINFFAAIKAVY